MSPKCRRFAGKVALVTGGANGFGRATVHRLVDEGLDQIFIVDRDFEGAMIELEKVRQNGSDGYALACDVSDPASVNDMGKEVASHTDHLDVLVNSAGIGGGGRLEQDVMATWDEVMNINLRGTVLVCEAVLPLLIVNGGSIVNISSDGGLKGRPGSIAYDASKAGVVQATKSMACDLVRYGIRVNNVAPGWAVTEFHFAKDEDPVARKRELEELETNTCIMRRLARPEEVAAGIAFLASDDASFVTSTTLCIDGGRVGVETNPRI